jgi:hypothetical protein
MGYQSYSPTRTITEKVPVVEKVSSCTCLEAVGLVCIAVKYQADPLVATSKKLC